MRLPELLLPAGSWEQFQAGMLYGGDAFYLTVGDLSLRATAKGFSWDELRRATELVGQEKKHIYFCLNLFARNKHLPVIAATLEKLNHYSIHGLIIADPGIIKLAHKYAPNIPIHLSTQANTSNSSAIDFWHDQGVERVNLARELTCSEILSVRKQCPHTELEVFVHGAMCMALSGRCLLSAYLNQRSANLGLCTQPCRFNYRVDGLALEEQSRETQGQLWELFENESYSQIFAANDLCLIQYLKWFIYAGIDAIKIEGRTKTGPYIARIADVYKTALKDALNNVDRNELYLQEIGQVGARRLTTGMFLHNEKTVLEKNKPTHPIIAQISEKIFADKWLVQIKEKWQTEQNIQLMLPGLTRPTIKAKDYLLEDSFGNKLTTVHPGTQAYLRLEHKQLQPNIYLLG